MEIFKERLEKVQNSFNSLPIYIKLLFLFGMALLARVLLFLLQIITIDGTLYIKMARLFSEGKYEGVPTSYFTLYPLILFLVQKLAGDWEISGQLISMTLGALTVIPVFLLSRSLYNEKAGWFSAFFYITLPNILKFDTQVLRDPTYWFFMVFTLYLVWIGLQKNRLVLLGLASISAGLGFMTRADGFVFWGALSLYVAFRKIPGVSKKKRALNLTFFIFLFPVILSPFLFSLKHVRNKTAFNEMISFSINVFKSHTSSIFKLRDPIGTMSEKSYESLPMISQDSLELARRHRIILAVSEVIYKFIKSANLLILLILLGMWKRKREGFGASDWYLLYNFAILLCLSVFYVMQTYYFSTRHGLMLVMFLIYFTGPGLDLLSEGFSRVADRFIPALVAIKKYAPHLIMIFIIAIFLAQGISFKKTEKFDQKEIGFWLKKNGYQESVIMAQDKFIRLVFYAEAQFLKMPDSLKEVTESRVFA